MADELQQPNQAENRGDVQAPVTPSPEVEEQAPQMTDGPSDSPARDDDQSQEDEHKPSRAERRIRAQNSKIRELEAQLGQLQPQPNQLPPWQQPQMADPVTGEVSIENLIGSQELIADQRAAQTEKRFQFQLDVRDVQSQHPELNPDSESYDSDLDQAVTDLYQQMGGPLGNVRLTKVVDDVLRIANKSAEARTTKTAQEVARQVAESGLTPSSERGSSDPQSQLSSLREQARQTGDWKSYFAAEARLRE